MRVRPRPQRPQSSATCLPELVYASGLFGSIHRGTSRALFARFALRTRTDFTEMVEGVDPGIVPVVRGDLDGVAALRLDRNHLCLRCLVLEGGRSLLG